MANKIFETLSKINVNDKTEKKEGLTYLSWPYAWGEVKKVYPNAQYSIWRDEAGRPYLFDEDLGYMVFTSITIEEETYDMWLPVMDSGNRAMRNKPYEIQTKYKKIIVNKASMFDINKTIMRCLVKNLAMFGLALYLYSGEDLPECEKEEPPAAATEPVEPPAPKVVEPVVPKVDPRKEARDKMLAIANELGYKATDVQQMFGLSRDTTTERFLEIYEGLKAEKEERKANESR